MKSLLFSLSLMIALLMTACTKSKGSHSGGTGGTGGAGGTKGNYAFANTEYTGTATATAEYYPKPICIHFNADSTVTAYECFHWVLNNASVIHDSITGRITSVGSDGNGGTSISVTFDTSGDEQVMTISSDGSGLTGGSISTSTAQISTQFEYVGLKLCPAPMAAVGGDWNTDSIYKEGDFVGQEYPDVETFTFFPNGTTGYVRNGLVYDPGIAGSNNPPVTAKFWQYGARVYFYGLNENQSYLIPYFGVLSPDGTTMYVDTDDFTAARLPVYGDLNDPYGPDGVTPMIHKQL